jgi:hypothetical protein
MVYRDIHKFDFIVRRGHANLFFILKITTSQHTLFSRFIQDLYKVYDIDFIGIFRRQKTLKTNIPINKFSLEYSEFFGICFQQTLHLGISLSQKSFPEDSNQVYMNCIAGKY